MTEPSRDSQFTLPPYESGVVWLSVLPQPGQYEGFEDMCVGMISHGRCWHKYRKHAWPASQVAETHVKGHVLAFHVEAVDVNDAG